MIISIEGNIGTGKSTLLSILRNKYKDYEKIKFVDEPLESWLNLKDTDGENILEKFYKNQSRWSYSFQMNAFITRSKSILNANPTKNIVIIERSVITDRRVFAELLRSSGKISELEWKLYEEWYNWLLNDYNVKPDIYVYLRCSPDVSFSRMKSRARKEEDIVPKDYITLVADKHDDWLLNEHESAVVTLDVNNDFEKNKQFRDNIVEIFSDILAGQMHNMASIS
tara:strand:- start:301 stop:975 length:675 start_codon:yes stop_codon:yes gene_type:complete